MYPTIRDINAIYDLVCDLAEETEKKQEQALKDDDMYRLQSARKFLAKIDNCLEILDTIKAKMKMRV